MGVLAEPARQGLGDGVGSQGVGEWGSQGMEAVSSLEKALRSLAPGNNL
jgi:hypothetical protein